MIRLGLETCFGACSVAAGRDGDRFASEFELRATGHAEALMPMIERVMTKADLKFSDLQRIAVTTGPGSFTGMRIGIAAARALALVTGAEIIGVPTLEVMAETARRQLRADTTAGARSFEWLLVAVDARKDQVYVQLFDPDMKTASEALVVAPQDAARLVPDGAVAILAGSGAGAVAAHLNPGAPGGPSAKIIYPDLQPSALDLCKLSSERIAGSTQVRPLYLRPPDAKPQDGKSIPRLT